MSGRCSVDDLLDFDDLLQEIKCNNATITTFLCRQASLQELVTYITEEPPPQADAKRNHKYPFMSAEVVCCASDSIMSAFVAEENVEVLENCWNFLYNFRSSQMSPLLAGYFSRAMCCLMAKVGKQLAPFLRQKEGLLDAFFEHLGSRSISDLFTRLLCIDDISLLVFPPELLVEKLVAALHDDGPHQADDLGYLGPDALEAATHERQEDISLILQQLVAQRTNGEICDEYIVPLFAQLTSTACTQSLVDCITCQDPLSISAAVAILVAAISYTDSAIQQQQQQQQRAAQGEQREEEEQGEEESQGGCTTGSSVFQEGEGCVRYGPVDASYLDVLSDSIPKLRDIVVSCCSPPSSDAVDGGHVWVDLPSGRTAAVGSGTLETLTLLRSLIKTRRKSILDSVCQSGVMTACIDAFFLYPWNSLLHNAVRSTVHEVLIAVDDCPELVRGLIRSTSLLPKATEAFRDAKSRPARGGRFNQRVGYLGHLLEICGELRKVGGNYNWVGELLEEFDGWRDLIILELGAFDELQSECLGGPPPTVASPERPSIPPTCDEPATVPTGADDADPSSAVSIHSTITGIAIGELPASPPEEDRLDFQGDSTMERACSNNAPIY